jgi:hypothetical protein
MTDRTKSALLIGSTLIIGMALGSLATGAIANRRLDDLAEARGRLSGFFLEAIEPETEEQAEAIRAVLDGAAPRFKEIFESTRGEMKRLSDSVMAELDPILTDEQKERLEKRMHLRLRRPPFGRERRPGFGDGPPGSRPEMRGPPPGDSTERFRRHRSPDGAPTDTVPAQATDAAEGGG